MTMFGGGQDQTRTANVQLTTDTSNYQQGAAQATQSTNKLSAAVDMLSSKLDGITKRAGQKLINFSAGDVATLGAMTASAAQFERQLGTLKATADISGASFKGLKGNIESTFTSFPVSRGEVVQLTNAISQMGVTGVKNIGDLTNTFIKLGGATGENTTALAQGLIQVSRQMGTTNTQQIGNFANALLTVKVNAGVSAQSILDFANNIAPMARSAGIGEAAVLGISAAFSKAGADGFVGANAFNKIIGDITQDIATGSPDLAKYSNLIGETTTQFKSADKGKAFVDIITAIAKQGPQGINILNQLGISGVRSQAALTALVQSGSLQSLVDTAVGSSGNQKNLTKGANDAFGGASDQAAKFRNQLTEIGTEIGTSFLKPMALVFAAATKVFGVLNMFIKPLAPVFALLGSIAALFTSIGGAGLLLAGVIGKIALATTVIRSGAVQGARQGFAVGRAPDTVNQASTMAESGSLPLIARPFYRAGQAVGSFFPEQEGAAAGAEQSLSRQRLSGIAALPIRAARGLVQGQTTFLQNSTKGGLDRDAPTMDAVAKAGSRAAVALGLTAKAAETGAVADEEETVTKRSLIGETGALAAAMAKLTGTTLVTGAKLGAQGIGKIAGGIGGALGPLGIAAVGVPLAISGYKAINNQVQQGMDITSYLNPLNKLNDSLGIASTQVVDFGNKVAAAAPKTNNVSTAASVKTISPQDIASAGGGRKVSVSSIAATAKANPGDISAAVANLRGLGATDPKALDSINQDLVQTYDAPTAQKILNAYNSGGGVDYAQLGRSADKADTGTFRSLLFGGLNNKSKAIVGNAATSIQGQFQNNVGTNAGAADQAKLQQFLQFASATNDRSVIGAASKTLFGSDITKSLQTGLGASTNPYKSLTDPIARQQAIITALQGTSGGSTFLSGLTSLGGTSDPAKIASTLANLNKSTVGASATQNALTASGVGKFAQTNATVVAASTTSQQDPTTVLAATKDLAKYAYGAGQGLQGATQELQNMKAAIQDTSSPLYALADAADQYNKRIASYATPYQSRGQQSQTAVANYQTALASTAPDAGAQQQSAQDALEQNKAANLSYLQSVYQTAQQYGVQMERQNEDMNKSIARSNQDFQLNQLYSQQDFTKQRLRSERDFGIQMTRQAQQNAQTIYDPYTQVQAKYTSDAGSTVLNLEQQNKLIQQQRAQLAQASRLGLSQQSIDTLNLSDPNNAQQLNTLIQGFAQDPSTIKKINQAVAQRVAGTTALTQSTFNQSYRNTIADYQRGLNDSQVDFNTAVARSSAAQTLALDRQAADYELQIKRSGQDLATAMTELVGSYATQYDRAWSAVNSGIAKYAPQAAAIIQKNLDAIQLPEFLKNLDTVASTPVVPTYGGQYSDLQRAQNAGHASGGVSTKQHKAWISEGNKAEAIIPLDARGASFMTGFAKQVMMGLMTNGKGIAGTGTTLGSQTNLNDYSTHFDGDVTVQAQDPNAMATALKAKARIAKLSRPARSTAGDAN